MGWERDVGWSNSQALDQEWAVVNTGAEGPCSSLSYGAMALLVLCFKTVNNVLLGLWSLRCSLSWSSYGLCCVIGIGQYASVSGEMVPENYVFQVLVTPTNYTSQALLHLARLSQGGLRETGKWEEGSQNMSPSLPTSGVSRSGCCVSSVLSITLDKIHPGSAPGLWRPPPLFADGSLLI